MRKINWENEKDKLKELIEKRVPFTRIAEIYGMKNACHIKKKAIQLGIKIYDKKSGKYYVYENPVFKCKHCGKEFSDRYKLTGHVTYCESNPNYKKNLQNTENARKNITNYSFLKRNKEYTCHFCGKTVSNAGCLTIHEKACEKNPNREKSPNRLGNGGHLKGHVIWNKGKTMTEDERVLKQSRSRRKSLEEGKFTVIGTPHTDETKRLLREKMITYIKSVGNGEFGQHFSEKGCRYIDFLNEKNGWNLIHAKNGGEKQVCGYFLDGYDENLNIAFEYDEPKHYKDVYNNVLCERDIKRQKEIINELKCKFYRYNEKIDKFYEVK
jgi:hypothetical protein